MNTVKRARRSSIIIRIGAEHFDMKVRDKSANFLLDLAPMSLHQASMLAQSMFKWKRTGKGEMPVT